jgi:hypothetical protein
MRACRLLLGAAALALLGVATLVAWHFVSESPASHRTPGVLWDAAPDFDPDR